MRPFRLAAGVLLVGALAAAALGADGQVVQTILAFGLAAAAIEVRLVLAQRRRQAASDAEGRAGGGGAAGGPTGPGGSKGAAGTTDGDAEAPAGGPVARGRRRGGQRLGRGDRRSGARGDGEGSPAASRPRGPSLLLERGDRRLVERAIGAQEALVIDTAAIDDADEPEHRTGVLVRVAPSGASLRFERRVDPPSTDGVVVSSGEDDLDAAYRIVAAHEGAVVPVPPAAARELVTWAGEEVEAELCDDLLLLRLPDLVAEERWADLEGAGQRLAQAFRADAG